MECCLPELGRERLWGLAWRGGDCAERALKPGCRKHKEVGERVGADIRNTDARSLRDEDCCSRRCGHELLPELYACGPSRDDDNLVLLQMSMNADCIAGWKVRGSKHH